MTLEEITDIIVQARYQKPTQPDYGLSETLRNMVREIAEHAIRLYAGPNQRPENRARVRELIATRLTDRRKVTLRENRGGWHYTGLSGTCVCLSEDGKQMVLMVGHDPENYWPLGSTLLVTLDHETQAEFEE